MNSSSLVHRTSDFSGSTPTGLSSKVSTEAESPSRWSKDVFCLGNVWLFRTRCCLKCSIFFTKDIPKSNERSHYVYWPGMCHEIGEMVRLCVSCAAAAKHSLKVTLHSWPPATKTLEAHSLRLRWSTFGKALSHRRGHLFNIPHCYFNVQHDLPADSSKI
jgi:hypothetical protein